MKDKNITKETKSKDYIEEDLFDNIGKSKFVEENEDIVEKKETYDLWKTLSALRNGRINYLNTISEEEKNNILKNLFIIMKWYSNPVSLTEEEYCDHLFFLNELINVGFWDLFGLDENGHSELIWKLMCIISNGKNSKHSWIPLTRKINSKIDKFLLEFKPLSSENERKLWLFLNGKKGLIKLYEKSGSNDKKLLDDLLKEYEKEYEQK